MMKKHIVMIGMTLGSSMLLAQTSVYAGEIPAEYRACVHKGLEWLAEQQAPDGHWEATGGQYPVAITALSGMSFLMEGSTRRSGKYADYIRRAVDWLISRSMTNGLIGHPNDSVKGGRYMYGHGFAILFIACIYGDESDKRLRSEFHDILTRAVLFSGKAQTSHGGWAYTSAADNSEGRIDSSSTVTQMQALRAARNAGIVVPKEIIDKGIDFLRKITNAEGGVRYGWNAALQSRLRLTAAALAGAFGAGEYESDLVKRWLQFCQKHIPLGAGERVGHDEYHHYY